MGYRSFPSSFDVIIARLRKIDIRDADAVACGIVDVHQMLSERIREETEGTGDLSPRWARLRIEGSVQELRRLEQQASGHRAPPEFVALVREVRDQAQSAWERTPEPATGAAATNTEPPDAPWVTEPVIEPAGSEIRARVVALDLDDI